MIFIFLLFQKDDLKYLRKGSKTNECHWRKFWIKRTLPQQRLILKGLWKNSLHFLIKRNPTDTPRMQQPAYHNTHERATWSHTPHCFWVLSVTGSIWECDWLKILLPKRRITSALHNANSPQLFCHGKLKLHIHIPGVDGIQGRAEPNTNVWLFFLKCSPVTVTKEFKDLQHNNFRLYMHFLLKRHQTALGANIRCWSCLISSGSSSTSYRVMFLLSIIFLPSMMLQVLWSFCTTHQLQKEVGRKEMLSLFYSLMVVVGYCKIIVMCSKL